MNIINTKVALVNLKGDELKEGDKPVLCGVLFANILAGMTSNPSLAWQLGKKFATEDKVELKAEEVVFVKEEIKKVSTSEKAWLNSMLAGQLEEILENQNGSDRKD